MRIISQKGLGCILDLPYEQISVEVIDSTIYLDSSTGTSERVIACYSTPEKAEKAMEMLWDEYSRRNIDILVKPFRFPEDSEV